MPETILLLDPALGLDADEIAAEWNAERHLREVALATRAGSGPDAFIDPLLAGAAINLIVAVVGGVSTAIVTDFIRSRLARSKLKSIPEVRVIEEHEPTTGDRRFVVQIVSH